MSKISILLPLLLSINIVLTTAKTDYKEYNLASPVDIPILLSGNFAELRSHHFHAGIDIKTQGRTGLPIYAPADGYVSRIGVSTSGYGKALYIDHPSLNLTTVYGHLSAYAHDIDSIAKDEHYRTEKYNINFFLDSDAVKVKKGQLVAYSGNTGSSAGPHLHFETRERSTQDPINPLLFGFDVTDTMDPSINGLRIYPVGGSVNNVTEGSKFFSITSYNGSYHLKGDPSINLWGKIGFGINTIDFLNGSWNKCGIYTIEILVDSQRIFQQKMDRISYDEMRYIDAHIDQETRRTSHKDYQYGFKAKENNPLSIYKEVKDNGLFDFSDKKTHNVKYIIKDTHGNESVLTFKVQSKRPTEEIVCKKDDSKLLSWEQRHHISNNIFKLDIPARAMYEDQSINYTCRNDSQYLAPVICLDNNEKWLNKKATLNIRPYKNNDVPLDKMLIAKVSKSGDAATLPTEIKDTILQTSIYNLGSYTVVCDTIAPTLSPVNIYENKRFTSSSTFGFKVNDDLSGVWDYTATIDNKWALFYYEYKNKYIYYTIDTARLEKGKTHDLKFQVSDATNNIKDYHCQFYW